MTEGGFQTQPRKKRLISEIQALSPPPKKKKNPARLQEIKAAVMDGLGSLAKDSGGFFSQTPELEPVHVKQSAAPGFDRLSSGSCGVGKI